MKRIGLLALLTLLVLAVFSSCASFMKSHGVFSNAEKQIRLEEFASLIGKEYYRRADLNRLTDQSEIDNIAIHKLIKTDIRLERTLRYDDYSTIIYTFEDGTTFDESRFYEENDQSLTSAMVGSKDYRVAIIRESFADTYINVTDGVQYAMDKIEENQERIHSEQTNAKLQKIHFALQGQSNGIKVIINISDLPPQNITVYQNITPSVFVNMQISSDKDISLNGLADNLIFSLNEEMCSTSLIFLNQRKNYPRNVIKNSMADFDVEITLKNPFGFVASIQIMKLLILRSIEEPEKISTNELKSQILDLFQFQFNIGSISLTIPLNDAVIRIDE
ncbi:MAG: hypothetical protein LBK25_03725 [Treponema sp.]|jgi:hypothetical protein|nr:hypothetical protein [Treponema sp.]